MKTLKGLRTSKTRDRVWRSGESTRLPPMWPGFDSRTRCQMWVEFVVGSRIFFERFFLPVLRFPPPQKPTFLNSSSIGTRWTTSHPVDMPLLISIYIYFIFIFKNYTLFRGTYLYSSYIGLPPPKLSLPGSGQRSERSDRMGINFDPLVCNRFRVLFMFKSVSNPAAL